MMPNTFENNFRIEEVHKYGRNVSWYLASSETPKNFRLKGFHVELKVMIAWVAASPSVGTLSKPIMLS